MDVIKTRAGDNYLTENEEKQLFKHLSQLNTRQAQRDYVLLKTYRLLGLRRVEGVRLNVGDVWRQARLNIDERIAAKGATGVLDIPVELQRLFAEFFKLKRQWGESLEDDAPLFVSRLGKRLTIRSINDIMAKWLSLAGIDHEVTPHGLRHTKGQRIVRDERILSPEMQRRALQLANRQLRHKSMNSTMIYTAPSREEMELVAGI